ALILVLLALPVLGLRLGFSDEGNYPEDTTTRKAYDLLADGFGPGFNGPLVLTSLVPGDLDPAVLDRVTQAVGETDGVAFAGPAVPDDPDNPSAVVWQVIPPPPPPDQATTDTVARLRDDVLPQVTEGTGLDVAVTGSVAVGVDFSEYLAARLPIF